MRTDFVIAFRVNDGLIIETFQNVQTPFKYADDNVTVFKYDGNKTATVYAAHVAYVKKIEHASA